MSTALVPTNPQPQDAAPIDFRFYLPSDAEIIQEDYDRAKSRKLKPLALRWYKFLSFWQLGNQKQIAARLYLHQRAVKLEEQDKRLARTLAPEAKYWGRLLSEHLARLKFSEWEKQEGRRKINRRIRFRQIVMEPERFLYQVYTSRRTATGAKSMLPWGINAGDLMAEKTITHLTVSLNRRVEAEYRPGKGLWFIVYATSDNAALPRHVSFHSMIQHMTPGKQELILGVGANRTVHIIDLDKRPHLLLAGSTGGGKSNSLNAMICMLIRMNYPRDLQMILIDLKNGVEFEDYEDIPHLATEVVTSQEGARDTLLQALALIKLRYRRMRSLPKPRPKSLTAYNKRVGDDQHMPRLVIIVDELAELLIGGDHKLQREIENLFIRVAQLGRAAGVHLLLSTQRPQKEIVSTAISAQMSVKMSHIMGTKSDSMTIFGTGDAAELDTVPGRAVYKYGWQPHQIQPPEATPEIIGGSTALAKGMEPIRFTLPPLDLASNIAGDIAGTDGMDYESQLVAMLTQAGGKLTIELLGQILGFNRQQAQHWLLQVADLTFGHDGKEYQTVKHGRSYFIEEVTRDDEDTQPVEVIEAPRKPEKWRVKR